MMKRLAPFALLACLLFCATSQAQHTAARQQLATSAVFDAGGRLWVVSVKEGRLWLQSSTSGSAESLPQAITRQPLKILAQGENRPKIALTPRGVILISFTTAGTAPYAGHVHLVRSADGGKHFSDPIRINDDGRDISHRFDNLIIEAGGRVRLVWIDRRDVEDARARGEHASGASIYTAWSDDDGLTWSANRRVAESSCECCRIALALDPAGQPIALWRHIFDRNIRDHAMMNLATEAAPTRATLSGWKIEACPHRGPALAIDQAGVRHLAWFAGGDSAGLYYSRLDAAGQPTGQAKRLTASGEHPAITLLGKEVLIAWNRFDGIQHRLEYTRSTDSGQQWSPPKTLATTQGAADYPQWAGEKLFWRTADQGIQLITPDKD